MASLDSFDAKRTFNVNGKEYTYFSLAAASENGAGDLTNLPYSLKVLAENMLRNENGVAITADDIKALGSWTKTTKVDREINFFPIRVLMPDINMGLLCELTAMRDAIAGLGGDPSTINPLIPVDVVVDHSVIADFHGTGDALQKNVAMEYERNGERYSFLKWAAQAFKNVRIVPPGSGILHQVNIEYIASVVAELEQDGTLYAAPDSLLGMDSHTTMANGIAVFGWGVGGLEGGTAMLGQPVSMLIPEVVGCRLTGELGPAATPTDLALTATQMLRDHGVVQKFVEFCGPGLDTMSATNRATLGNMSPEYGATMGFSPIDENTLSYLRTSGRSDEQVALVETYAKEQGLWRDPTAKEPIFTDIVEIDLSKIEPCVAGPSRPNQKMPLSHVPESFSETVKDMTGSAASKKVTVAGKDFSLDHGNIMIAAITSCTNTSNPTVMMAAGLLARNARAKGLERKPWVKASLSPGSQVVADYFEAAGLQGDLDALGFNIVGFGCVTCMGNSGPLEAPLVDAIEDNGLIVGAVLSGNRNFEGRVHPQCRANYLASPPLVVAYALAGSLNINITTDSLGDDKDGNPVYLKDIWPSPQEVQKVIDDVITPEMFRNRYGKIHDGTAEWQALEADSGIEFNWPTDSEYIKRPPLFEGMEVALPKVDDINSARCLIMAGDMTTTDHISPISVISKDQSAGQYLLDKGIEQKDFNTFGARRTNHEVMVRGTFGNIRFRNELMGGREGGYTRHWPDGEEMSVFDAAMKYKTDGVPLVVVGAQAYGTGSSRDWAAKGTMLLGIRAVIAETFERIHRSNLIGMGVLPLQFPDGMNRKTLHLDGTETYDIIGIAGGLSPKQEITCTITREDGSVEEVALICRLDTEVELEYFNHGGMLQFCLRQALVEAA
ncbi:MAG: aconitate hydratase AcnA [Proteobacteria bacterium]|nr:aconitate hydratase AcnA [Pseudomonadota bacterium]